MKVLSIFILTGCAALAGCGGSATNAVISNGNAANMRGANTNTGYLTNSETNVRPAMPANVTNISPPSMSNANHNTANHNSAAISNVKSTPSPTKKP